MSVEEATAFFKSVSHQLYGNSNHQLEIRALAVQYLRNNPERFIESNLDGSWLSYLSRISMQGTWADNIVIQVVADSLNLRIHIVESSANFSDLTLVESMNTEVGNIRNIRPICRSHRLTALCQLYLLNLE